MALRQARAGSRRARNSCAACRLNSTLWDRCLAHGFHPSKARLTRSIHSRSNRPPRGAHSKGVSHHGRAGEVHRPAARRGDDVGAVPGVRHLAQDRLQDPRALPRLRGGGADRPLAPTLPARQPAALPDRDADRQAEAGEASLGRAEDQGAAGAALSGCAAAGDLHGARGARPPRAGEAPQEAAQSGHGHASVVLQRAQRAVVRRLQGDCQELCA